MNENVLILNKLKVIDFIVKSAIQFDVIKAENIRRNFKQVGDLKELTECEVLKEFLNKVNTVKFVNVSETSYSIFFYSNSLRKYRWTSEESRYNIFVKLEDLVQRWRQLFVQQREALKSLTIESIFHVQSEVKVIKVFNIELDSTFCYRFTRANRERILQGRNASDLEKILDYTKAFKREIAYLRGYWGCQLGLIFYSELYDFFSVINAVNDYQTREDFINNILGEGDIRLRGASLVNLDKTVPFICHLLQEQDYQESLEFAQNLFKQRELIVEGAEEDFRMAQLYETSMLDRMIPEYDGKTKESLLSFIWSVDKMVRGVDPNNVQQLRNIAVIAKSKIKSPAREFIVAAGDTWTEIRRILVVISGRKNANLILAELSTMKQHDLNVHEYFKKVRDLMMDLILIRTEGLEQDEAVEAEEEIQELAKDCFIEGLHTDLSTYTMAKNPETLNEALSVALEREETDKSNKEAKTASDPLMQLVQKLLEEKLEKKSNNFDSNRQKNGNNNNYRRNNNDFFQSRNYNQNNQRFVNRNNGTVPKRFYTCNKIGHFARECPGQYCDFHRTYGHSSINCRSAKNEMVQIGPQVDSQILYQNQPFRMSYSQMNPQMVQQQNYQTPVNMSSGNYHQFGPAQMFTNNQSLASNYQTQFGVPHGQQNDSLNESRRCGAPNNMAGVRGAPMQFNNNSNFRMNNN